MTHPDADPLPPGQRAGPLRRFGLLDSAAWGPDPSARPEVTIDGEIGEPLVCDIADLIGRLGRRQIRADLHCVATWSATNLEWSGLGFTDYWGWLRDHAELGDVSWLRLKGLDGSSACLSLADALSPDVLLADRLNGEPVPADHGAPLRLVAPAHYGYKNIKNLCAITLLSRYRAGSAGRAEHPRARVAQEERGPGLPGWVYRGVYGTLKPAVFAAYDRRRRKA